MDRRELSRGGTKEAGEAIAGLSAVAVATRFVALSTIEGAVPDRREGTMATFFVHQRITAFANQYRVYDDQGGVPGALIAFAHQKRLAFREKFTFYDDESQRSVAFQIQARKVLDFGSSYDVQDAEGRQLGVFRKVFGQSLLRSTWEIVNPANETEPWVVARERSMPVAIIRRIWDFIPYIGDAPFFIKYHFDLVDAKTDQPIGEYFKTTRLRDQYRLVVDDRFLKAIDWRTFICLGVAMDALQGR
jgi:uncharacterized protein YxjI